MRVKKFIYLLVLVVFLLPVLPVAAQPEEPTATTYYVSSSEGDDDNDGLSDIEEKRKGTYTNPEKLCSSSPYQSQFSESTARRSGVVQMWRCLARRSFGDHPIRGSRTADHLWFLPTELYGSADLFRGAANQWLGGI